MRLEQLTFTRFIAAASIVIFHWGQGTFLYKTPLFNTLFSQADVGVSYFFVLSGFVMIMAYNRLSFINAREYYFNRFCRIFPLYLIALISIVLLFFYMKAEVNYKSLLLNFFLVQAWVPAHALRLNGPGWSISVEMLFYLSFPFLVNKFYKRYPLKYTIIMVAIVWLITQVLLYKNYEEHNSFPSFFPLYHINEFVSGNAAGLLFLKYHSKVKPVVTYIILLVFPFMFYMLLKFHLPISYHNGFLAIVYIPFIVALSLEKGVISKFFNARLPVLLGEISFSIYLLQLPVYIFMTLFFNHFNIRTAYNFWIFFFLLVFISYCVYISIELPAKKYLKKAFGSKISIAS